MIEFLFWLQLKHFIIDFPLQGPFQYRNKGKYGHPGGLVHSGLHFLGTFLVIATLTGNATTGFLAALFDGVAHYHIDWAKVRVNAMTGWGPTTSEQFWWLLGFDQLLHQLCYIAIVMTVWR